MEFSIRPMLASDAEAAANLFGEPLAAAGTLHIPYESPEIRRERMSRAESNHYRLVAVSSAHELIGVASLFVNSRPRRQHCADLGMAVRDSWQGRGVGSALMAALCDLADQWLPLERIELTVYVDNGPAIALYKKFGFEIEGTLRRFAWRNGGYVDAYAMARLRAR